MHSGKLLPGNVRLDKLIAKTNMSEVWRAIAPDGATVVVKALRAGASPESITRGRFARETEILSRKH